MPEMAPAMSRQPRAQKPKIVTQIPGPKSQLLTQREQVGAAPGLQRFAMMAGISVDHAEGSAITDVDGNTFLDLIGGIGVNGLGHSHPRWKKRMTEQLERVSVGSFTSEPRVRLFEKLFENRPTPRLSRFQLYSSGAEAVESALRLAKCATGRYEVISFWGGFHGKTLGAMSLMGSSGKNGYGPMAPGNFQVMYADCYRCPLGLERSNCGTACAEVAKQQIRQQSSGSVAAVIVEPMQGTAGNIVPPKEFLPIIQQAAHEMGALFITDEMITGFGRTGKFWGAEHFGLDPDIVTLGKQFGGGYPLSAIVTTEKIAQSKPWGEPSGSSSSYGGNPLAAASALAAIEIIEEENLLQNVRSVGELMLATLKKFETKYPFVGFVDGAGLFLRVELVEDKKTKKPLRSEVCHQLFFECLNRGLLTMSYAPHFRLQPAMTIDAETATTALAILDEAFAVIQKRYF